MLIKSCLVGKKRKKSREKEPEEDVPRNQPCKVKKSTIPRLMELLEFFSSYQVSDVLFYLTEMVLFPTSQRDGDGEAAHDGDSLYRHKLEGGGQGGAGDL